MKRLFLTLTTALLATVCLSGCNNGSQDTSKPSEQPTSSSSVEPVKTFTVKFFNYDDTLLDTVSVKQGETAVYTKDKPTKPATLDYYYSFKGWDKDLTNVSSDFNTKATFEEKSNIKQFSIDKDFVILQNATEPNKDNTNYMQDESLGIIGVDAGLYEPVIVEGEEQATRFIKFNEMQFDYSKADFKTVGCYEITITFADVVNKDILNVVPDVSTWNFIRQYIGHATSNVTGPDWWTIEYIDFYNEGVVLNTDSFNPYFKEDFNDGKSVRIYKTINGNSVDVAYDYSGEGGFAEYSYPGHEATVGTLEFVVDNPPATLDPSEFKLFIHQTLDEAISAYGTVENDGTYSTSYLTAKYDYDASNKSIKIHLEGFPKPFTYNEADGKYHC